jgi:hypothetical protein
VLLAVHIFYYIIFILASLNAGLTLASLLLAFELKGIIVIMRLYLKIHNNSQANMWHIDAESNKPPTFIMLALLHGTIC